MVPGFDKTGVMTRFFVLMGSQQSCALGLTNAGKAKF